MATFEPANGQLLTFNDTEVISSTLVNEVARWLQPDCTCRSIHKPRSQRRSSASTAACTAMPQINIAGGTLEFGGNNGEPSFRGDYTAVLSDGLNWVHGKHSIKFGGEFRRNDNNNYSYTPGTFTFPTITAFINDQATAFQRQSVQPLQSYFREHAGSIRAGQL